MKRRNTRYNKGYDLYLIWGQVDQFRLRYQTVNSTSGLSIPAAGRGQTALAEDR